MEVENLMRIAAFLACLLFFAGWAEASPLSPSSSSSGDFARACVGQELRVDVPGVLVVDDSLAASACPGAHSIYLRARTIVIAKQGLLVAGDAPSPAPFFSRCEAGLTHRGLDGAAGGDIILDADTIEILGTISPGNGGAGQDLAIFGMMSCGTVAATGGDGGRSGQLILRGSVRKFSGTLAGGIGGTGGNVRIAAGESPSSNDNTTTVTGANGTAASPDGEAASASGNDGAPPAFHGGDGWAAIANGGHGGPGAVAGGRGGAAIAWGGNGTTPGNHTTLDSYLGQSLLPEGGRGGDATAWGGAGGIGPTGGSGGLAFAIGGSGGNGPSLSLDPDTEREVPAGKGGDPGNVIAFGGHGGIGTTFGGHGGHAFAYGGYEGAGGDARFAGGIGGPPGRAPAVRANGGGGGEVPGYAVETYGGNGGNGTAERPDHARAGAGCKEGGQRFAGGEVEGRGGAGGAGIVGGAGGTGSAKDGTNYGNGIKLECGTPPSPTVTVTQTVTAPSTEKAAPISPVMLLLGLLMALTVVATRTRRRLQ